MRSGSLESVVLPVPERPKKSATSPVCADVRRAVHRHDASERQQVVQDAEDRLLDLARVARAGDEHEPLGEVERDDASRAGAVARGIGLERRRVDDRELRRVRRRGVGARVDDEQVAREQVVPRVLGDDADRQAVRRVGAGVAVLDVELAVRRAIPRDRGAARRTAPASIGRFTLPQAMCASLDGSRTRNLSFGERPVWWPVRQTSGPSAAIAPSSRRTASSYSAAVDRFHFTRSVRIPSRSRPRPRSISVLMNGSSGYECVAAHVRIRGSYSRKSREVNNLLTCGKM